MKLNEEFSITVDGYYVGIEVEVSPNILNRLGNRPRWHGEYEEMGGGAVSAMETIRLTLEDLDDEEFIPVGTSGFGVDDLFIEHEKNQSLRVKDDNDEVLAELTEEQLTELLQTNQSEE